LRAASGEIEQEFADWWTDFLAADNAGRESLLAAKPLRTAKKPVPVASAKKPQLKKLAESTVEEIVETDAPVLVAAPRKRRRRPKKPTVTE
jgi:hypothetical protein